MKKRLTAFILILTMLWSSGLDVLPGLWTAYATPEQEGLQTEVFSVSDDEGSDQTAEKETGEPGADEPAEDPSAAAPAGNADQAAPSEDAAKDAPEGNEGLTTGERPRTTRGSKKITLHDRRKNQKCRFQT